MTSILEFYAGEPLKLKNGEELTLNEILQKDDSWLDGCHDFIQWIFPTRTVSNYCLNAPILTEEIAKVLATDYLSQFQANIFRFAKFLDSQDMTVLNHNHLRITRMIECSSLIADARKANPDLYFLIKLIENYIPLETFNIIDVVEGNRTDLHLCSNTAKYWFQAFYSKW